MMYFLGWLFFSVAAAMFASIRRNRSGGAWFAVALVFSPLVAFMLLLILRPLGPQDRKLNGPFVGAMCAIGLLVVVVLIFLATLIPPSSAQQQVFRNELGQTTGTATQSGNQTTYRDAQGRTLGTGTVDSSGTTVFRDSRGRAAGSVVNSGRR